MNKLKFIKNMKKTPEELSTLNLVDIFKVKKKIFIFNNSSILLVKNKFNKKKYVQKCIRYTTLEITSLGVFFKSSTKISVSSSRFVVPSILSKNCAISANFIIN